VWPPYPQPIPTYSPKRRPLPDELRPALVVNQHGSLSQHTPTYGQSQTLHQPAAPQPTAYAAGFSTVPGDQNPITVCIPDPNGGNPLIYALPPGTSMMLAGQHITPQAPAAMSAAMHQQPGVYQPPQLPQPGVYQPAPAVYADPQPQAQYQLQRPQGFPLQLEGYQAAASGYAHYGPVHTPTQAFPNVNRQFPSRSQ